MMSMSQPMARPDALRKLNLVCGIALGLVFFLPYAEQGGDAVMSFEIASRVNKLAFLLVYPAVAGLGLVVLSLLQNVPPTARAAITGFAGFVPLATFVFKVGDLAPLASRYLPSVMLFYLSLLILTFGMVMRMLQRDSNAARGVTGLGMALVLLQYLVPQQLFGKGESMMPLVVMFRMATSEVSELIGLGFVGLVPFFLVFFCAAALPRSSGKRELETTVIVVAWALLLYIPANLLFLAAETQSKQPGWHVMGLLNVAVMAGCYLALFNFGAGHLVLTLGGSGASATAGLVCTGCGAEIQPGDRFCDGCGAPVAAAAPAAAGPAPAPPKTLTIGREETCGFVLPDRMEGASRQHARLAVEGSMVFIEDLNSANGTYLNGKQIQRAPLRPGDRVRFGKKGNEISAGELLGRLGL